MLSLFSPSVRPWPRPQPRSRSRRQGQILFRFAFGALLLTATCGHIIRASGIYIYLRSCHMCCTDIVTAARGENETRRLLGDGVTRNVRYTSRKANRKLPKSFSRRTDLHLHRKRSQILVYFLCSPNIAENKQTRHSNKVFATYTHNIHPSIHLLSHSLNRWSARVHFLRTGSTQVTHLVTPPPSSGLDAK